MEDPIHKPLKPILHEHNQNEEKQPRKKSISWDEQGIEAYEKERGKTQKITEPKTPYSRDIAEGRLEQSAKDVDSVLDDATKENTIKNKHLSTGVNAKELHRKISEETMERREKDAEREEEAEKHKAFEAHRKKHYDEGPKMKQILKRTLHDENEDPEDKEEDKFERLDNNDQEEEKPEQKE